MADAKARASGPMWAATEEGKLYGAVPSRLRDGDIPCRILPGHGKWVPVELVETIRKEMASLTRKMFEGSYTESDVAAVHQAIDAAKEGKV